MFIQYDEVLYFEKKINQSEYQNTKYTYHMIKIVNSIYSTTRKQGLEYYGMILSISVNCKFI